MKELIIGLLGGGVFAEVLNIIIGAKANRRKLQAEALDTEVTTMEHTLRVLADNMDREIKRHDLECERMQAEIAELKQRVCQLTDTVNSLRAENRALRA